MSFEPYEDERAHALEVQRLENYHRHQATGWLIWGLALVLLGFVVWALNFRIDEVTRAQGEVIASSRVQVIQAVDGGVLSALLVKEGDRVKAGQVLARLDRTRVAASAGEVTARLVGLRAKVARLRAEVTGEGAPQFPNDASASFREQAAVERALFLQRREGLQEDLRTLRVALELARKEQALVEGLQRSGDVSAAEVLRTQRSVNEAESRVINRRNKFLEDARIELARAEDEMSQAEQVLARRQQEVNDSTFVAAVPGIVKNIRVTTLGGVLRAGEEIMQIVPVDDDLIIEAKVRPADIARVHPGLPASVRLDPFDYTIYGAVPGKVSYVSADTLKESTPRGEETYYRVHVRPNRLPITSNTGRNLDVLPGMTAQIDIRTGDRTLMDYLLKPLRKTVSESFGER